jgi:hypothetical protein
MCQGVQLGTVLKELADVRAIEPMTEEDSPIQLCTEAGAVLAGC